ncbi:hypothetical protein [Xylanimonas sp. McL0601]|uniref:hypothetical protein n=1 Tax=Xylanimonas sp. McL0601 TaxID=3414739 RepID=UPI003CFAF33A
MSKGPLSRVRTARQRSPDSFALTEQVQGFDVAGCDDDAPAWIVTGDRHTRWDAAFSTPYHLAPLPVGQRFDVRLGSTDDAPPAGTYTPSSTPITVHGRTTPEQSDPVAFVPAALVAARVSGGLSTFTRADVVADGGPTALQAVEARAHALGLTATDPTAKALTAFHEVRAVVYGVGAIAISVAVLTVALAAVDRARERRRNVAHQAMIGVPGSVLRRGQTIQVMFPALVAGGLALGALSVQVIAHLTGVTGIVAPQVWATLVGVVVAGVALVALATLPLTRTRLTAELLRRE